MLSLQELFSPRSTCRGELENLSKSIFARAAWARLTPIQRLRIEIEAVGDTSCTHSFVPNVVETLGWWLGETIDDEGTLLFPGLRMEKQVDGLVTTIKVWDEESEFLVRVDLTEENRGTEYSKMAKRGEATLDSDED